jgi:hypothetical protein
MKKSSIKSIFQPIPTKVRSVEHVTRMTDMKVAAKSSGILQKKDRLGDLGVDGRIIFKLILKKYGVMMWPEFVRPRIGFSVVLL